jgi:tetratricopeptide (TPR) repeat protein
MITKLIRVFLISLLCVVLTKAGKAVEMNDLPAMARQAQESTNFDLAISRWSEVLKTNPKHFLAHKNRGYCYIQTKQLDKAISDLNKAIKLNFTNEPSYSVHGNLYDKDTASAFNLLGMARAAKGQYKQAIADLNWAVVLDSKNGDHYANRALAFYKIGALVEALWDADKALELQPGGVPALMTRSQIYTKKREWDKALSNVNQVLQLEPGNADALYGRGAIYEQLRKLDKAVADFSKAIELAPNVSAFYDGRGYEFYLLKKYKPAVADYNEAIRREPANDHAMNNLAWLRATCPDKAFRDGKEAVKLATQACELYGWKDWNQIGTLAAAYAEAGDFEQAIQYQKRAMAMKELSGESDRKQMQQYLNLFEKHRPIHQAGK